LKTRRNYVRITTTHNLLPFGGFFVILLKVKLALDLFSVMRSGCLSSRSKLQKAVNEKGLLFIKKALFQALLLGSLIGYSRHQINKIIKIKLLLERWRLSQKHWGKDQNSMSL